LATANATVETKPAADQTVIAPEQHYPFLDVVRFGAALLVLLGHSRGLLLEGIGRVEHPNALTRAFYLVSGLQHEGVVLFFVVSGFLIGGSVWRMMNRTRFDFGIYFINRFARIYLVYIPALLLVLAINIIGNQFFMNTRFYGERPLIPSGTFAGWTWDQIPCHLVALQSLLCTPWGANLPVWSLGFEWAFYMIAPAIFSLVLMPLPHRLARSLAIAALLAGMTWLNSEWLIWFTVWLMGVLAANLFEKRPAPLYVGLCGLLLCGGALVLSRLAVVPLLMTDFLVAIGITAAVSCRELMRLGDNISFVQRGAAFSYSLYLIHLPVGILIGALYERFIGWPPHLVQPDGTGILGFCAMVVATLLGANLFALLTEDHTSAFRRRLMRLRSNFSRTAPAG
jgi:peptidoglycan/LPS O-acetylase OafA/YrhL